MKYREANHVSPTRLIEDDLARAWGDPQHKQDLRFPLYMRLGEGVTEVKKLKPGSFDRSIGYRSLNPLQDRVERPHADTGGAPRRGFGGPDVPAEDGFIFRGWRKTSRRRGRPVRRAR